MDSGRIVANHWLGWAWAGRRLGGLAICCLLLGQLLLQSAQPVGAANCRTFAETGKTVCDQFLDYWLAHGDLAINGFPLTDARYETLENGQIYLVQWFERVRMEYHPENANPQYQVLLGQFGRQIHPAEPGVGPKPGQRHFPETGHNMEGAFLLYWEANGGLAQFGYPLTEPFQETLGGQSYLVQYTERARFELHPENQPPYLVLLGQFGRQLLAQVWGPTLVPLADGQAYNDPAGKFKTMIPHGWAAQPLPNNPNVVAFTSPDQSQLCSVATNAVNAGTTVQQLDLAVEANLSAQAGYQAVQKDQVVVQGKQAYRRIFLITGVVDGTSTTLQTQLVYYITGTTAVAITCGTAPPLFAGAASTFDGIAGATKGPGIADRPEPLAISELRPYSIS